MGPPLEYESISFLASSTKFKAAASPLFSGLLISELHARRIAQGFKTKLHTKKKGLNSQKLKLTCNDLVQVSIWIQD